MASSALKAEHTGPMAQELKFAIDVCKVAGKIGIDYEKTIETLTVHEKVDKSPVTKADMEINAFIVKRIKEDFADDLIVAEEDDWHPEKLSTGRTWFVDPIDGTKSFLKRTGEWAILIGLIEDGLHPKMGVVAMPTKDIIYFAVQGFGAWMIVGESEPTRISCTNVDTLTDATIVKSRESKSQFIEDLMANAQITKELTFGSLSLRVMQVAAGNADLYISNGKSSLWDICSVQCIIEEAGGQLQYITKKPITYAGSSPKCEGPIVASNRGLMKQTAIMDVIEKTRAGQKYVHTKAPEQNGTSVAGTQEQNGASLAKKEKQEAPRYTPEDLGNPDKDQEDSKRRTFCDKTCVIS